MVQHAPFRNLMKGDRTGNRFFMPGFNCRACHYFCSSTAPDRMLDDLTPQGLDLCRHAFVLSITNLWIMSERTD